MKRFFLVFLFLSLINTSFSQETREERRARRGQSPGYASRDATTISMMGWGVGIAVGIALLCSLLDNNSGSSSTTSSGT